MEALKALLEGSMWDHPHKLAAHEVQQQIPHALVHAGHLREIEPEIEGTALERTDQFAKLSAIPAATGIRGVLP